MGIYCIDVTNGYTISVIDAIKILRMKIPEELDCCCLVMLLLFDMTQELILVTGADIVKVGETSTVFAHKN